MRDWQRVVVSAALVAAAGCASGSDTGAPAADFLVVAGDSTFWISTDTTPARVRRSPIFLARFDGRFYEVYLADDDRSYFDAVIVGHRVYRRDVLAGDSTIVFEDTTIASVAAAYAAAHPGERPLKPGEEEADDPGSVSTSETEIIGVLGPYVTLERHSDFDLPSGGEKHETRRSVVDMRTSQGVTLADLMPDSAVRRVIRDARRSMDVTFDSVRQSRDERAQPAAAILGDFVFDPESFTLTAGTSGPAVAFLVPGRGLRAGGYALPLPPIDVPRGAWWEGARVTLPEQSSEHEDVWKGERYDVVARYDVADGEASIVLRLHSGGEWTLSRVPTPVERVIRLDDGSVQPGVLRALRRAFDEATHYADPVRTTSGPSSADAPSLPRIVGSPMHRALPRG
jgi:hypothetical protein